MSKRLTAENSSMIDRLQTKRWSAQRWAIYYIKVMESAEFQSHFNIGSTVNRMNDAFHGERKWKCEKNGSVHVVTRIQ